jgi:thiamine transport system permease protein
LGATAGGVLRRIELPLVRSTLAVAAVFAVGTSLGEFGATLSLRRPETVTVPLAISDAYGRLGAPFQAQAHVYAALLLMVAIGLFLIVERIRGRSGGEFA